MPLYQAEYIRLAVPNGRAWMRASITFAAASDEAALALWERIFGSNKTLLTMKRAYGKHSKRGDFAKRIPACDPRQQELQA